MARRIHTGQHAKDQAKDRHEVELSGVQLKAMVDLIQRGKSICGWKETDTRKHHILKIGKKYFHVIYSTATKQIVTFLPPERIPGILLSKMGTDHMNLKNIS